MTISIRRRATALALAVPFVLSACVTGEKDTAEPIETGEAATEETAPEEELDPNDPNVLVCPVTGIMQRIDDDAGGHHSDTGMEF